MDDKRKEITIERPPRSAIGMALKSAPTLTVREKATPGWLVHVNLWDIMPDELPVVASYLRAVADLMDPRR